MKKFKSYPTSRKVITIILIILAVLVGYKILDATYYPFVRAKAEIYLCMKYDAKPSEIKLVDHQRAHIYWDDDNIFWLNPEWVDFSFEYTYNDKSFFVCRHKGKFYDDHQIDDVEKWCTDWLKENIDKRITSIEIDSDNLQSYCEKHKNNNSYIYKESDAFDFISHYADYYKYIGVYYYDEQMIKRNNDHEIFKEDEILEEKFKKKFGENNLVDFKLQVRRIDKEACKDSYCLWNFSINFDHHNELGPRN